MLRKIPDKLFILILFFLLIGFGYLQTANALDPDFGWHIKTGELILERGVPYVDWYSFTMPNFPWIDHEWLTDILLYKFYSVMGFQWLLVLFLVLVASSFLIFIKKEKINFYLVPVFFGFLSAAPFIGVRPQVITLFFVAILWKVLLDFLCGNKEGFHAIYLIPLLFLVWVNLHGGFAAGLFVLGVILLLEIFKRTKLFKKVMRLKIFNDQHYSELSFRKTIVLSWVLFFSFLATLINPYGLRIYEEVFRTVGDNFLRFHIMEWLPLFWGGGSAITIFYLALSAGLIVILRKKIELSEYILPSMFLISSFANQRHFPIFVVLSIPVVSELLFILKDRVSFDRVQVLFSGIGKFALCLLVFSLFFSFFYPTTERFISEKIDTSYPRQAINFLSKLPLSDNLLNDYGWGGYLIWKLPERKVFIDGRMPSWRQNGEFVFGDYIKIMDAEGGFQDLLNKYDIRIVLLRETRKEQKESNGRVIANLIAGIIDTGPDGNLYKELVLSGWSVVYDDGVAVILRHPSN